MKPHKILTRLGEIEDKILFEKIVSSDFFLKKIKQDENFFPLFLNQIQENVFNIDGEIVNVKYSYPCLVKNLHQAKKVGVILSFEKVSDTIYKIYFDSMNFQELKDNKVNKKATSVIFFDIVRGVIKGGVSLFFDYLKLFIW